MRMAVIETVPSREVQLALEPSVSAAARAALRAGATLFDARRFWDAHEAWEEIWQAESRPIRSFYQGLIQIAAGYHHWTVTRRPNGVQILLAAATGKLSWYRPAYLDVDVDAIVADAERMRGRARGKDAAWLTALSSDEMPPFRWLPTAPPAATA